MSAVLLDGTKIASDIRAELAGGSAVYDRRRDEAGAGGGAGGQTIRPPKSTFAAK